MAAFYSSALSNGHSSLQVLERALGPQGLTKDAKPTLQHELNELAVSAADVVGKDFLHNSEAEKVGEGFYSYN